MGNCESSLSESGDLTDFEILRKKIQTKLDFETHREAKWLRKVLKLKEKELEIKECEIQQLQLTAELRNRQLRELEVQLDSLQREKTELIQKVSVLSNKPAGAESETHCGKCSSSLKSGALTPRSTRSPSAAASASLKDPELEKLKKAIQAYKDQQLITSASSLSSFGDKVNTCKVRKISIEKVKGKKQEVKPGLPSPVKRTPKISLTTAIQEEPQPKESTPVPLAASQVVESFFRESQIQSDSENCESSGPEPEPSSCLAGRTGQANCSEQEEKKCEKLDTKPEEKKLRIRPYDPIVELKIHIDKLPLKFMNPPRRGKKCLVLDIDYTMFDNEFFSSKLEDASNLNRPYLHEFMQICYADYDLVLWSATSVRAIDTKMKRCGVYSHPNYKITLVLSKTEMFQLQTAKNPIDTKALQFIWAKFPDYYTPKNTIHIDDIPQNFTLNPQQGLRVKQYRDSAVNKFVDKELFYLSLYLSIIGKLPDFSQLDHSQFKEFTIIWLYERLLREQELNMMNESSFEEMNENISLPTNFGNGVSYPTYPVKKDMIIDWFGVITNISIFKKPISEDVVETTTAQPQATTNLNRTVSGLPSDSRRRSMTAPVRYSPTLIS